MAGGGSSSKKSNMVVKQYPGVFSGSSPGTRKLREEVESGSHGGLSRAILQARLAQVDTGEEAATGARQLEMMGSTDTTSPFQSPLQKALMGSEYGSYTAAEEAGFDDLGNRVGGITALRGLGAPTKLDLAKNMMPAIQNAEQNKITNLMNAFGADAEHGLNLEGIDTNMLLDLIALSMPELVGGNRSSGWNIGTSIDSTGVLSGMGTGTTGSVLA